MHAGRIKEIKGTHGVAALFLQPYLVSTNYRKLRTSRNEVIPHLHSWSGARTVHKMAQQTIELREKFVADSVMSTGEYDTYSKWHTGSSTMRGQISDEHTKTSCWKKSLWSRRGDSKHSIFILERLHPISRSAAVQGSREPSTQVQHELSSSIRNWPDKVRNGMPVKFLNFEHSTSHM